MGEDAGIDQLLVEATHPGQKLLVRKEEILEVYQKNKTYGKEADEDGAQDIACAKAAGAHSIGVEGGIQGQEQMLREGPDFVLKTLAELPALIERLQNPR